MPMQQHPCTLLGLNFRNSPLERRTMFSRKVFCGATSPLLPPCILRVLGRNSELLGGLGEDHSPSRQSACSERDPQSSEPSFLQWEHPVCKQNKRMFQTCQVFHSVYAKNAFHPVSPNQIRYIEESTWILPNKWVAVWSAVRWSYCLISTKTTTIW